jgi:hypothetical protein
MRKRAYQYGTRINGRVERHDLRSYAENAARDWVISPLRSGPRTAELVRRLGWDGEWESLATWTSPEGHR